MIGSKFTPRAVSALALLASVVVILGALSARPPVIGANAGPYHAGELLVATDEMKDPRFVESVIYLVKHDADGALGLVINRPLAQGPIDDLLKGIGAEAKGSKLEVTLHYGGPVSSRQVFMLHSDEMTLDSSVRVSGGIAMTADIRMINAIAEGKGPRQYLFMLGYTGWAPGQLEMELKANSWFTVAADKALIFGADADKKWRQATDKRQIPL
ncbi:MAG: YqgE/AlgH family protein [Chloroflexota bacterium]